MRPKLVTALCLLTAGACAHQQQPTEESARATASNTQMTETARSSPAIGRGSSTAAMQAQPAQPDPPTMSERANIPPGATSQPRWNPPLAGATATEPPPSSGQQQAIPMNDVPVPPGESREVTRAPSAEDIALRERIQNTLGSASGLSYSARHVSVVVDKQDVTLKGDVRNDRERKEVESLVQQIQGVKRVKNQLSSR